MGVFAIVGAGVKVAYVFVRNFVSNVQNSRLSVSQKNALQAQKFKNVEDIVLSNDSLRYKFSDYLKCVELYGRDVANMCLDMSLDDVRTSFVYFLKERGL